MNEIIVKINFEKQICDITGINLITNDYNSTKIKFTFDKENGTKIFKIANPKGEVALEKEIVDNEIILAGKDENDNDVSIFTMDGDYPFEVVLYDGNSRLTSARNTLSVEKCVVSENDEEIEIYKPLFDQLMEELNVAINETENLDISATKVEDTATITITKKDGTEQSVEVTDGTNGVDGQDGQDGKDGKDGVDGKDGKDATINGESTINIVAGKNVTIDQSQGTLTINSTGGGVSDYSELENKPKINSVELSGNKSLNDLGIQPAGNYLTNETDPVFSASASASISSSDISNWNNKAEISDIPDVSSFITKDVNNLTYYYKQSETYTKTEVDNKIASVYKYKGTVSTYGDLPSSGQVVGDVYNVEQADSTHGINAGDNVAWTGSAWDKLSGNVDLSGYQTKIDSSNKLSSDLVTDTNNTNLFVTASDKSAWNGKQDALVSGTNIKTINNTSLLGEGNITINEGQTIQYSTMPTASASNLGEIVQYIGATNETYTNGYFYQVVSDGGETPTYSWGNINVQSSSGGGTSDYTQLSNLPSINGVTLTGALTSYGLDINYSETEYGITFVDRTNTVLTSLSPSSKYWRRVSPSTKPALLILDRVLQIGTQKNKPVNLILFSNSSSNYPKIFIFHSTAAPVNNNANFYVYEIENDRFIKTYSNFTAGGNQINFTSPTLAFLSIENTITFTPTSDYHPSTKKYVDDKLSSYTGYDATKTQVLKNVNGTLTWQDEE